MNRDELKENILDYFTYGAPGYHNANEAIQSEARNKTNDILAIFDTYTEKEKERVKSEAYIQGVLDGWNESGEGWNSEYPGELPKWIDELKKGIK
jgi:hypothetical protein